MPRYKGSSRAGPLSGPPSPAHLLRLRSFCLRSRAACFAACKGGPILCVQPDGTWYYGVTEAVMDRIITEHLVGGEPVREHVFHQAGVPG